MSDEIMDMIIATGTLVNNLTILYLLWALHRQGRDTQFAIYRINNKLDTKGQ